MNTKLVLGLVALLVVVVGGVYVLSKGKTGSYTTPKQITNPTVPSATSQTGSKTFTIDADDNTASLTNINVKKGDAVSITFRVKSDSTYHGGLDFRSDIVNTGTITPGSSKTVTFTAGSSFQLIPYWPQTNIRKPYVIQVTVQ